MKIAAWWANGTIGRVLGAALTLGVFTVALWVLHDALRRVPLHEVTAVTRGLPPALLALSGLLSVASYLLLSGYDWLAMRHLGHRLRWPIVATATFASYAFSHNIGLSLLTGGSVRYRIYSAAGLTALETAAITVFSGMTFALGSVFVVGLVLTLQPAEATLLLPIPSAWYRSAGLALLLLLSAYAALTLRRRAPIRIRDWSFHLPSFGHTLAQMVLALADLSLAGAVFWVLLPAEVAPPFNLFLAAYVFAQLAAVASHVPGGLGVVETVLLLMLPGVPTPTLLGAALAYRVIYYLLPFTIALLTVGVHEARRGRGAARRAMAALGDGASAAAAPLLGLATLLAGTLLLLSGAVSPDGERIAVLQRVVPLPVVEGAHVLASVTGFLLLIAARGLFRRLRRAMVMSAGLLAAGSLFSLLKGGDWVEASLLAVVLVVLLAARFDFPRRTALLDQPFGAAWMATLAVIVGASIWLGLIEHRHVPYRHDLWWRFAYGADISRFLRASLAVIAVAAVVVVMRRRRRRRVTAEPRPPDAADLARAASIVAGAPAAYAHLARMGDKMLLFSPSGRAFLMCAAAGNGMVALGDPVGPSDEHADLLWGFRDLCDRRNAWPALYLASADLLPLGLDIGLAGTQLGADARVPLAEFDVGGDRSAGLARSHALARRRGATFELVDTDDPVAWAALRAISDAWRSGNGIGERGFAAGRFERGFLAGTPCVAAVVGGRRVAFASLPGGGDGEVMVDLLRFAPGTPAEVIDFLLVEAMRWSAGCGDRWFNLGLAPPADLADSPLLPLWRRIGGPVFRPEEFGRNLADLRGGKDRFRPQWRPRYLAAPGGLSVPHVMRDVATLLSSGNTGLAESRQPATLRPSSP